jgi:hypothetical protein
MTNVLAIVTFTISLQERDEGVNHHHFCHLFATTL